MKLDGKINVGCMVCDWRGKRRATVSWPCPGCGGTVLPIVAAPKPVAIYRPRYACGHLLELDVDPGECARSSVIDCRRCRAAELAFISQPIPREMVILEKSTGRQIIYRIPDPRRRGRGRR